jgi:hypothetical protein
MPRYNTSLPNKTITGTTTIVTPDSGSFVQLVGTAPYTVTLPAPAAFPGQTLTFHNTTSGTVTLSTPSGAFTGLGASGTATQPVLPNTVASVISDSVNYVTLSEDGSVLFATDATITGNLTVNTPGTTTTISPANLTINPGNSGSVNNVNIGASTRGSGAFTSLTANSAVTLTANTTSSGTSSGTLVVTGGVGVSGTVHAGAFNGPLTGTLQTAAQPNITSVGTLSGLTVTNTITGSVSGSAATATTAGTVTTAAQPNITSVGTLSSLAVSGALTAGSFTVPTAAQPNITSVGTLSALTVSGNVGIGAVSSPLSSLHIRKPDQELGFDAGLWIQSNPGNGSANRGGGITFNNLDVYTAGIYAIRQTESWNGALTFYTHTSSSGNTFGTTFTEKVRIDSDGMLTVRGETRQVPPADPVLPTMLTTNNRVNLETAIVAPYQGGPGTRSFSNAGGDRPHYFKKFFNMNATTSGAYTQNMVQIDSRNVTNFNELWIKITWGTRIQGISDATSAMCERAYGCNKFNGNLINYSITNAWNHIDGNSDTHMDIVVVNSPTPGILLVQYQQSGSVSTSSFIWGYIEIMSQESLGPGGIPILFNC